MKMIDLRSDTVTRPTAAMRAAMADAEVGDDFYGDDPTVRRLEEKAADLLGKKAALLVLSGTMGNLVAILAQTRRGDAVLTGDASHIFANEGGHLSALGGLTVRPVPTPDGAIAPADIEAAQPWDPVLQPPVRLVCLENAHNAGGGRAVPIDVLERAYGAARAAGMRVHIDGARVFNAACALGRSVAEIAAGADTLTFCLTKGLGAPAGSLIVCDSDLVGELRRWRQVVGGGMRQAGVFAAAGIVSLDTMVERLVDDHDNARSLARGLAELQLPVEPADVQTNMVFLTLPWPPPSAADFVRRLREAGVLINPPKGSRVRFVTHHDVSRADVAAALERIRSTVQAMPRASEEPA